MSEIFFNDGGTPRSLGHTADPQLPGKVSELEGRVDALEGVTPYVLPPASVSSLGGVKVDGTTITAGPDGTISAVGDGSVPELSDAVDSDSSTTAASSRAVKMAYDTATEAKKTIVSVSSQVKRRLTQPTTFYVNGETGDDALDEGRGLSESKPFRTAQAAIDHLCSGYDFQNYNCFLDLSGSEFPENLNIHQFETLSGKLIIRGAGAEKTFIIGSILGLHAFGTVVVEPSVSVKCPDSQEGIWRGVGQLGEGELYFHGKIEAGENDPSLVKYCLSASKGTVYVGGADMSGYPTQFFSAGGGTVNIIDDCTVNGSCLEATAVAATSGRILCQKKVEGEDRFPNVSGTVESGAKFGVYTCGLIMVSGQGPNFFPGAEEGIVEEKTGGVYA